MHIRTLILLPLCVAFHVVHLPAKFCRSWPHLIKAEQACFTSPDTASAHSVVSIHTLKSGVNIWRGDFLLNNILTTNHCTLPKRHVLASYFLALKYDHVTGAGDVIFILVWDDRRNWWSYIARCNIAWDFFVIARFWWVLVRSLFNKMWVETTATCCIWTYTHRMAKGKE
jgi:hypothetical protein